MSIPHCSISDAIWQENDPRIDYFHRTLLELMAKDIETNLDMYDQRTGGAEFWLEELQVRLRLNW